jgi:hypothetical protein
MRTQVKQKEIQQPAPMKDASASMPISQGDTTVSADILILCDGTVLVHNLTPALAAVLNTINPQDATIKPRALAASS